MKNEQYVCTVCGYNMAGYYPDHCPFCGAPKEKFITSEACSAKFKVKGVPVNEKIARLNSVPSLGLEHAAYRIETNGRAFWIDCPSCFDKTLTAADAIMFTHNHFLGASNQYHDLFHSRILIHKQDSTHKLCRGFTFSTTFEKDFIESGIEAFPIGGHTPGFTLYLFEDVLLICDYVFFRETGMRLNPFGPQEETRKRAGTIKEILQDRKIKTVCGFNYVADYHTWKEQFDSLLNFS